MDGQNGKAMKIGIVIAMDKELARMGSLMDGEKAEVRGGMTFVTGRMGRNDVVMTQCGIGKVNAAMGTTMLIEGFEPDIVVSTGVAGGASTELNVQEVVVSSQACYHDVYCGKDVAYGQIQGFPARFEADRELLEKARSIACATRITSGLIVTGDWFVDSSEKMQSILDCHPDALAVDMESAAIAQVCFRRATRFISFRIISDIPLKEGNTKQYFNFWERMAESSFEVTRTFLQAL